MGKFIDLTGQQFGQIKVLSYHSHNKHHQRLWNCQCSCSRILPILTTSLTSGRTKSCGCQKTYSFKGKIFGNWVVIKEALPSRNRRCLCQCNCGKTKEVLTSSLINGKSKSCGCRNRAADIGKKFGKLTAIQKITPKNGRTYWLFKCDCGNTKTASLSMVKMGECKSCGCIQKSLGEESISFQGYKEISKTFWNRIELGARNRNIVLDISIQEAFHLLEKQNFKCALSNMSLNFGKKTRLSEGTASLDRIDSSKGYTIDNVQWVNKEINIMKNKYTQEKFIRYCHLIAENHPLPSSPAPTAVVDLSSENKSAAPLPLLSQSSNMA